LNFLKINLNHDRILAKNIANDIYLIKKSKKGIDEYCLPENNQFDVIGILSFTMKNHKNILKCQYMKGSQQGCPKWIMLESRWSYEIKRITEISDYQLYS
jgi:hypothetical protein